MKNGNPSTMGITEKCPRCKELVVKVKKVGNDRFCFSCGRVLQTGETYVSKDWNPDNRTMLEKYLGHN